MVNFDYVCPSQLTEQDLKAQPQRPRTNPEPQIANLSSDGDYLFARRMDDWQQHRIFPPPGRTSRAWFSFPMLVDIQLEWALIDYEMEMAIEPIQLRSSGIQFQTEIFEEPIFPNIYTCVLNERVKIQTEGSWFSRQMKVKEASLRRKNEKTYAGQKRKEQRVQINMKERMNPPKPMKGHTFRVRR